MVREPAQVRAPLTKAVLELLETQPEAVRLAVLEQASEAVRVVEEASRVSWIPLRAQLEILAALRAVTNDRVYDEFCAKHFSSTVEQPLVKSVFDTTVRLFGVGPGPVYRMFPKTWAMMARGCGVIEVDEDGKRAHLEVSELPVEEPEIELFVRGFRATFAGVLDMFRRPGTVTLDSFDPASRIARYTATWR
ncbi:MAG: hypothetical protein KF901_01600 [Myxococcales bacterium]|nr:hypothetical protein [Myxococcales bacterium]